MKKSIIILLIAAVIITLGMVSCKKDKKDDSSTPQKTKAEMMVGRWKSVERNYFEVYYSDGTGKEWDADEVEEEDADTFTWAIDAEDDNYFLQTVNYQGGQGVIPNNCHILKLTDTRFKYTTDDWRNRFTEDLERVE